MGKKQADLLVINASELATPNSGSQKPLTGKQMGNLSIIKDGGLAVHKGKIVAVGKSQTIRDEFRSDNVIDAYGKLVMPGFVDAHSHLVFAGSREEEFELRIKGASYLEVLEKGGGILSTVRETRKATIDELVDSSKVTLDVMLLHGTTTVEAKSGYGLSTKDETKLLEIIQRLDKEHVVDVVPTFLGAHAVPSEYEGRTDDYVQLIVNEMIPEVANKDLAAFCDVFCEKGVFTVEQSRRILLKGKECGLVPKVHADELSTLGGTELAAQVGAISAEHLLCASDEGLKQLARKGVVAVLLPAASFALMMGKYAEARKMIEYGVPVALGTDYNPSCWVESMQLVMAFACREMELTPAEAITAATINAAHAVNRGKEVGSLEVGKKADIIILDAPNHNFLGYRLGTNQVDTVVKEGVFVVVKGKLLKN